MRDSRTKELEEHLAELASNEEKKEKDKFLAIILGIIAIIGLILTIQLFTRKDVDKAAGDLTQNGIPSHDVLDNNLENKYIIDSSNVKEDSVLIQANEDITTKDSSEVDTMAIIMADSVSEPIDQNTPLDSSAKPSDDTDISNDRDIETKEEFTYDEPMALGPFNLSVKGIKEVHERIDFLIYGKQRGYQYFIDFGDGRIKRFNQDLLRHSYAYPRTYHGKVWAQKDGQVVKSVPFKILVGP